MEKENFFTFYFSDVTEEKQRPDFNQTFKVLSKLKI